MTAHLRTLIDLGAEGLAEVLSRAATLKALRGTAQHPRPLADKTVAVVLEKASTRTRLSFDVGVAELGGHPSILLAGDTQMGRGEELEDTAAMLSCYVHAVVYRTFGHDRIERFARACSIPVINGLSDRYHPCQLLADLQTVIEQTGRPLEGLPVAWIGDGNNMANSWIVAAGLMGVELTLACPEGYEPHEEALRLADRAGRGSVKVVREPEDAVRGAVVVNTDVWASMGQEEEARLRRQAFERFTVDERLMARAAADAVFLHCLPAHRGEEVSSGVIDGPSSRVRPQAENRLHAQKALLEHLLTP